MQNQDNYQPSFNRIKHLKRAVSRLVRRRKALGQYIVVAHKGQIQRIDFSVIKELLQTIIKLEAQSRIVVKVDPRYFRPAEVETLSGDLTKAKETLGWVPEITVQEMCAAMVAEDLKMAQRHALLKAHGHDVQISVE